MLAEFIRLIRGEIDRAIYVWGGQGQVVTSETQIRRMEQTASNADRAIALWLSRKPLWPVKMFDCSGLIIWALQTLGLIDYDTTADGLRRLSKPIALADLRVGDLVFKVKDGRAYHVGVVLREGYVTEAYGRDRGVIERATTVGNWNAYGTNPFINTSLEVDEMKKGDTGLAVTKWQECLLAAGYKMTGTDGTEYTADGSFGGATERATIAFQLASGLPGSGVVGDLTWAAMTKALTDKIATALAEEARRAAYLVGQVAEQVGIIDKLKAEKVALTDEAVKAKAAQVAAEQFAKGREAELARLNERLDVVRKGRDALNGL